MGMGKMAKMSSDSILMGLANELKGKDPDKLTREERDYLAMWDTYSKRKGLGT